MRSQYLLIYVDYCSPPGLQGSCIYDKPTSLVSREGTLLDLWLVMYAISSGRTMKLAHMSLNKYS